MANRVDDLITGFSETKSHISGIFSPSIPDSEQETILNLTEDIRTRKNVIFYSPPHHARFFLALEAALPLVSEFHKQIVIILKDPKQMGNILPHIRTYIHSMEESHQYQPFLTLDLSQFGKNPVFRNKHSPGNAKPPVQESSASLPISSMIQTLIRKFPVITGDMIPELSQTKHLDPIELLSAISSAASVIVCSYEDVFAFHPLQPSIFKSLIDVEQSIVVYDDCHQMSDFVQSTFSFHFTLDELRELHSHLAGEISNKSNLAKGSNVFLKKFLTHFLRFLAELQASSSKYHEEVELRVHEFLHYMCNLHHCSMELLQSTFFTHISHLLHSSILLSHQTLHQTLVDIFNLFFLTFRIQENAKIPYGFTIRFGSQTTFIGARLFDPRFYTDALFRHNFASISMSSAMDVRFYLSMLGLGNIQRGFIIRSLPSDSLVDKIALWGDAGVSPNKNTDLGLTASKYAAKIVHHAHVIPYPTLVCIGSTNLFEAILNQDIEARLQDLGRDVIIAHNSDDLQVINHETTISKEWKSEIVRNSSVPIVLVNLATFSVEDIIPALTNFQVVNFISFPLEPDNLSLRKQTAFLTRKYDLQQAEMFRINRAFSRINAICANIPYNSRKTALVIFFDGLILQYQRYLLPWAHQLITYIPASSDALKIQSASLLSSPHLSD